MWYNISNNMQKPPRCFSSREHDRSLKEISMLSISQTPSIYQIRHIKSGKVYVGSAVNPRKRCRWHYAALRRGAHYSPYLQHAWDKHGEDAFVFEILEPVLFVEDLIPREQYWIDTKRAANPAHGFNGSPTAGSPLGRKHTDEARAKISERQKAHFANPVERAKHSERTKARCADPVYRATLSERAKKQFSDPVQRANMIAREKVRGADPAVRAKASEHAKAAWADPVYRAKRKKEGT
jgi:group I intron endonuclease